MAGLTPPSAAPGWSVAVFSGQTILPWLRLLRPGFRHCFAAVETESGWVVVDPLAHTIAIQTLPPCPPEHLTAAYRAMGLTAVAVRRRTPPKRALLWRPFTCVEAVKRMLGIQHAHILTPWQLYRHISSDFIP